MHERPTAKQWHIDKRHPPQQAQRRQGGEQFQCNCDLLTTAAAVPPPQAACLLVKGSLGYPNGGGDYGPYFSFDMSEVFIAYCEGG